MKKILMIFLQALIVLLGIAALTILIRFPMMEGRAENLDLFNIYSDPFILYGYASSIVFFIALIKAFKLLGNIGQDKLYSPESIKVIRSIKNCAILLSILIVLAGIYIRIFYNKQDDPAGFLAMCILTTFVFLGIVAAMAVFEKKLLTKVYL